MKELYKILEISKQSHFQYINRQKVFNENKIPLIGAMLELRQFHPKMGAKKMYIVLKPDFIGRDGFIELYNEAGLKLYRERSYRRTTFSNPSAKYTNLTIGKVFTDINQLWSSDITYLAIGADVFLYITFIMDVYSRRIIGYNVSEDLSAASSLKALKMALKTRGVEHYEQLIHHSDKGTQYTSGQYTDTLKKHNIAISMCNSVYENTHIERVNGTIKNDYLSNYKIKNLAECQRTLKKVVNLYNSCPHWSLNGYTPFSFENALKTMPESEKIHLTIYHDEDKYNCQNVRQLKLDF